MKLPKARERRFYCIALRDFRALCGSIRDELGYLAETPDLPLLDVPLDYSAILLSSFRSAIEV